MSITTEAYFDNIQSQIISEINFAKSTLEIAVAWMTDRTIFKRLCEKAEQGIKVELLLINDDINNNMASFNHLDLETKGGKVYFIQPNFDGTIMHHKFCVIDNCTVITGSYNWSNNAQQNNENIIITRNNYELAKKFQKEFVALKKKHFSKFRTQSIVPEPRVWQMLKTMDTFKREELIVANNDTISGLTYYRVPDELIEYEEWEDAFKGVDKSFTIKGDGPLVTVGIAVALRSWTPDTSKGQTGKPITKGDFKRFAIS